MNDFNKPIRPISKKDNDKIKEESITEKFKDEQEFKNSTNNSYFKNNFILTYLASLRIFFTTIFQKNSILSQPLSTHDLRATLAHLKILLEKIRDEDPTHDLKFAEEFSSTWTSLLHHHQSPLGEPLSVDPHKVDQLIEAIDHYPTGAEHTLGFYLTRYSSQDWFPIPFFQLLNTLHEECWNVKKNSDLDLWIALTSEILAESNKH